MQSDGGPHLVGRLQSRTSLGSQSSARQLGQPALYTYLVNAHPEPAEGGERGMADFALSGLFHPRTSVVLIGSNRARLNWLAYAFVRDYPGGFLWGHVRLEGEVLDDDDLLKTQIIPPEKFISVAPSELMRNELAGNVALGGLSRSEEDEESVSRFADFLRLPEQTQRLFSELPTEEPRPVLVLSCAHRLATLYPIEALGPTVRSVVELGGSTLQTWADAPSSSRFAFEHILHLKRDESRSWRDTVLAVEKGWPTGPLRTGAELRVGDLPSVEAVFEKSL